MGTSQILKISFFGWILLLLFICSVCSDHNLQVKGDVKLRSSLTHKVDNHTKNSDQKKVGANNGSDVVAQGKNKEEKVNKSEEVGQNASGTELLHSEEDQDKKKSEGSSHVELKGKEKVDDSRGGQGFDSKSEKEKVEVGKEESSSSSVSGIRKEKLRDEECDPSNMCIDKKKNLTACLRVPGNDSPDISLLIKNRGSRPLNITIIGPKFIQIEETKVRLQQNEDKKVKITLAYEGMDSLIFLVTEDSRCTLDFRALIPSDLKMDSTYGFKLRYLNSLTRTHWLIFLSLSAVLVLGSACMFLGFHKKLVRNGYQTLEMELPVAAVSKTTSESNDNWDNNWEDNWDDAETPMTPTLPTTPNLSSKGLSSRRLIKDGWKD